MQVLKVMNLASGLNRLHLWDLDRDQLNEIHALNVCRGVILKDKTILKESFYTMNSNV